jgi:hypothetical protein
MFPFLSLSYKIFASRVSYKSQRNPKKPFIPKSSDFIMNPLKYIPASQAIRFELFHSHTDISISAEPFFQFGLALWFCPRWDLLDIIKKMGAGLD